MMYSYIGAYITHLCHDYKVSIVYASSEEQQDGGWALEHHHIPLPYIRELFRDTSLHDSHADSGDTEAKSESTRINPEWPPVWTWIYRTPHLHNHPVGKPISN